MNEYERNRNLNRRRQADWVVNAAKVLSVVAWVVAFVVMLLIDLASPERSNFFTNTFGGVFRTYWDPRFLWLGLGLLMLSFLCCVFAFIFNMKRMRRKTDKFRKSVLVMGIMSFVGIIIFILRFVVFF